MAGRRLGLVRHTDDGVEFHDRAIAATDESWFINAFSYHPELGFSMLDEVIVVIQLY